MRPLSFPSLQTVSLSASIGRVDLCPSFIPECSISVTVTQLEVTALRSCRILLSRVICGTMAGMRRGLCVCVSELFKLFMLACACLCCVCRALRNLGVCFGCDKVDNECQ